jgi:ketosteroid isomerase-like protein
VPTPEENRQFVIASYRAIATRDRDQIAPFFALDVEWRQPESNALSVALGQPAGLKGREALLKYFTGTLNGEVFTGSKVELLSVVAGGDVVIVEQRFEATVINGHPFKLDYCFVFVLRDGLIQQVRTYFDTVSGFKQMFGDESPRQLVGR